MRSWRWIFAIAKDRGRSDLGSDNVASDGEIVPFVTAVTLLESVAG